MQFMSAKWVLGVVAGGCGFVEVQMSQCWAFCVNHALLINDALEGTAPGSLAFKTHCAPHAIHYIKQASARLASMLCA